MRVSQIVRSTSRADTLAFIGVGQYTFPIIRRCIPTDIFSTVLPQLSLRTSLISPQHARPLPHPGRMGSHMVQNILLATLNSPTHPQLTSPTSSSSSPEWLSNPKKLKRILICDPFKDNVDRTLERMKEVLGSHTGVEVGVVESESRCTRLVTCYPGVIRRMDTCLPIEPPSWFWALKSHNLL